MPEINRGRQESVHLGRGATVGLGSRGDLGRRAGGEVRAASVDAVGALGAAHRGARRVGPALALYTRQAPRTGDAGAGILDAGTRSVVADLGPNAAPVAGVVDTQAVKTGPPDPADDPATGGEADPLSTELALAAAEARAGVWLAGVAVASLALGAAGVATRLRHAGAEVAGLKLRAVDVEAGVFAGGRLGAAGRARGADGPGAGVRVAVSPVAPGRDARQATRALAGGVAGHDTLSRIAEVAGGAGGALVDEPVTVVVLAVADLVEGLSTPPAGVDKPLVDDVVAIVVEVIADLVAGPALAIAGQRPAVGVAGLGVGEAVDEDAGLTANAADADVSDVQRGATRPSGLVGEPVTVIIKAIAELFDRRQTRAGRPLTRSTDLLAAGALAEIVAAAPRERAVAPRLVVRAPVAVVVDAIADLRRDGRAAPAGVDHVLIDGPVAVIVSFVARLDRDHAARSTRVANPLVGDAVAVIVLVVAHLWRRAPAAAAGVENPLVDPTVAVVVVAIAGLSWDGVGQDP